MTGDDQDSVARLQQQIADLQRRLAEAQLGRSPVRTWTVGELARVVSRDTWPVVHLGDVGEVVAVYPRDHAPTVHPGAAYQVVVLDFGPDVDGPGGRDTWGYADADLTDPVRDLRAKRGKRKG